MVKRNPACEYARRKQAFLQPRPCGTRNCGPQTRLAAALSEYTIRLAHFNQRHHPVLQREAFSFKFVRCAGWFHIMRRADQYAHFSKWLRNNETVPASQPPAARIFQIHWQHRSTGFLCEKNDAWPKFVNRATWTVRRYDHIAP